MKKVALFIAGSVIFILLFVLFTNNKFTFYIIDNFIYNRNVTVKSSNEYKKDNNYNYIQSTNNFHPKNKQELQNVFYTILNKGWNDFSFFCDRSYDKCIDDVTEMTTSSFVLSNINNFVHPFNSFDTMSVTTNNFGKITLKINYLYHDLEDVVDIKVNSIMEEYLTSDMDINTKIKTIHDYIINTNTYDQIRADIIKNNGDKDKNVYESNTAYGALFEGKAICGGYTDAMALFLTKLGLNNYKVATKDHVWNAVEINDKWYHIDLTWDDPIIDNGDNVVLHNYFLLNTKELLALNTGEHIFDSNIYSEVK